MVASRGNIGNRTGASPAPEGVRAHEADGGREQLSHHLVALAERSGQLRRAVGGERVQVEAVRHVEGHPVSAVFDIGDLPALGRELFHRLGKDQLEDRERRRRELQQRKLRPVFRQRPGTQGLIHFGQRGSLVAAVFLQ